MESIEQEVFNSENFVDTNLTPTDVASLIAGIQLSILSNIVI
jgi:hypothetical protein